MKINIFKTKKSFKKGSFHTNPNIAWELVLCVSCVLLVFFLIFSYRLFMRINRESSSPDVNIQGQAPVINKDRLDKALNYFSERKKKFAEILNSPAPVVDPSL